MTSFFLFEGLERLGQEADEDEAFLGTGPDGEEEEYARALDAEEGRRWERLIARHALVRQARSFVRLCDALGRRLAPGVLRDREARSLVRYARRVPHTLAEALVAEVNGAEHRDCDAACVAYDIAHLMKTRRDILRSRGLLEALLARYPERREAIFELMDEAAMMEIAVASRIVDMSARWARKL